MTKILIHPTDAHVVRELVHWECGISWHDHHVEIWDGCVIVVTEEAVQGLITIQKDGQPDRTIPLASTEGDDEGSTTL